MNWITVIWSMNAGATLTLAAFYGAVWSKQRENRVYLLFSCSAAAAAVISAFELWMMRAWTVEQYQLLLRWMHVPMWVLIISFVACVLLYLQAGRAWLAWSIYSLRTLIQILNFSFSSSISAPVSAQLYRIAQEAVRDAIEHGAACQVLIQLTFGDRSMMLTVQDDGQGFDTKFSRHGMGLRIMRYRAQCIGSSCEVHAGPTQGTIVHCRVPLEAQHSVSTLS